MKTTREILKNKWVNDYTPDQNDFADLIDSFYNFQSDAVSSLQGPQGVSGYTPIKGIDYFDGEQGLIGNTGVSGSPGQDGLTTSVNGIEQVNGNIILTANDVSAASPSDLLELVNLLGRTGGQTINGDTVSGGNLTLSSTSESGKGKILFGTSVYDEVNNELGIGISNPISRLHIDGTQTINEGGSVYVVMQPPSSATATNNLVAGSVTGTNLKYAVTFVTAMGETSLGLVSNIIASATANGIDLTNIPIGNSKVTARKIYRTSASQNNNYFILVGTISNNTTTTFQDNTIEPAFGVGAHTGLNTTAALSGLNYISLGDLTNKGKLEITNAISNDMLYLKRHPTVTARQWVIGIDSTTNYNMIMSKQAGIGNVLISSSDNSDVGIQFQGSGSRGGLRTNGSYNMFIEPQDFYGSGHLVINSTPYGTGNVGIGQPSPTSKLHCTTTVSAATGNQVAYRLDYTTNKLTSGDDTGLLISMTDTASPGLSLPLDIQVGGVSKFNISAVGDVSGHTANFNAGVFSNSLARYSGGVTLTLGAATYPSPSYNNYFPVTIFSTLTQTAGNNGQLTIIPTYNQVESSASNTDLLINRLETAVGSGSQKFISCQVSGAEKFSIKSSGNIKSVGIPVFVNNTNAVSGGLSVGEFYRTGADPDVVCVVH